MSTAPDPAHSRVDVKTQSVARVYAQALLAVARQHNAVEDIAQQLESLLKDVAGTDAVLATFFLGGVTGREHHRHALTHALKDRVHPILLNFLLVLNDHERLEMLRPVLILYREMVEKQAGNVRVSVRSAAPLPDDQRDRLLNQLRELTHKEPILDVRVEPDLLGGLVVQIGDWRYDASVRRQLDSLRNQLIERSSHVIEAERDRVSTAS